MSTADAVGIVVLITLWAAVVTLLGVAVGRIITRRNRRR